MPNKSTVQMSNGIVFSKMGQYYMSIKGLPNKRYQVIFAMKFYNRSKATSIYWVSLTAQ